MKRKKNNPLSKQVIKLLYKKEYLGNYECPKHGIIIMTGEKQ